MCVNALQCSALNTTLVIHDARFGFLRQLDADQLDLANIDYIHTRDFKTATACRLVESSPFTYIRQIQLLIITGNKGKRYTL